MDLCTKCKKFEGNILHAGICNVCYSNATMGDPKALRANNHPKLKAVHNSGNTRSALSTVGIVLFWAFVAWFLFGGLLEGNKSTPNTTNVDCRDSGWANSPYCDGTYEDQARDQSGIENNYYQNIVR